MLAELSGVLVFPSQGVYTLALSCEGWCNLSLYGSLLAESQTGEEFADAATFALRVEKPGPFPYRILYHQARGRLGVSLRWSAASGEFEDVPPQRLFTDSHMGFAASGALLTGSIPGVSLYNRVCWVSYTTCTELPRDLVRGQTGKTWVDNRKFAVWA